MECTCTQAKPFQAKCVPVQLYNCSRQSAFTTILDVNAVAGLIWSGSKKLRKNLWYEFPSPLQHCIVDEVLQTIQSGTGEYKWLQSCEETVELQNFSQTN